MLRSNQECEALRVVEFANRGGRAVGARFLQPIRVTENTEFHFKRYYSSFESSGTSISLFLLIKVQSQSMDGPWNIRPTCSSGSQNTCSRYRGLSEMKLNREHLASPTPTTFLVLQMDKFWVVAEVVEAENITSEKSGTQSS